MSTDSIHRSKWRLALFMLMFTVVGGAVLVILLALGLADPPRAGGLIWQSDSDQTWQPYRDIGEAELRSSSIGLPEAPFTLELQAGNYGASDSAWGIWIQTNEGIQTMLVTREGYLSVSGDEQPHWAGFIHIRSDSNKLYLHVESDHSAILRINDEIAWTGSLVSGTQWGTARFRNPVIQWESISIFNTTP